MPEDEVAPRRLYYKLVNGSWQRVMPHIPDCIPYVPASALETESNLAAEWESRWDESQTRLREVEAELHAMAEQQEEIAQSLLRSADQNGELLLRLTNSIDRQQAIEVMRTHFRNEFADKIVALLESLPLVVKEEA